MISTVCVVARVSERWGYREGEEVDQVKSRAGADRYRQVIVLV